jgi:hypothetical protein
MKIYPPKLLGLDKPSKPVKLPKFIKADELELDPDGKINKYLQEMEEYRERSKDCRVGQY